MDNAPPQRRLPWGTIFTLVLLACTLAAVLRLAPDLVLPAPWPAVAGACLAAAAAFLIGRWLLNYFWGVVLAMLLTLHPLFHQEARGYARPVAAEALALTVLALLTASWCVTFAPRFRWRVWLLILPGLVLAAGLAWLVEPRAGLTASVAGGVGLVLAAVMALTRRRRPGAGGPPSAWNAAVALLGGLIVPTAGLLAAPALAALPSLLGVGQSDVSQLVAGQSAERDTLDLLGAAVGEGAAAFRLPGFTAEDLAVWCWPVPWVVLPLAILGLWRGVRRGRLLWRARRPPLGWLVPLYAVVDLLGMALNPASVEAASLLPLAPLSVLLGVFCLGDITRGVAERMMLRPPHEEEAGKE
jgi:hypothetical protein